MKSEPLKHKSRVVKPTGLPELDGLRERVLDLESRVRALAISRRALISLLVSADKKRKTEVQRLRAEVEKLRARNARYSKALAVRDRALHRLQFRLNGLLGDGGRETDLTVVGADPPVNSTVWTLRPSPAPAPGDKPALPPEEEPARG